MYYYFGNTVHHKIYSFGRMYLESAKLTVQRSSLQRCIIFVKFSTHLLNIGTYWYTIQQQQFFVLNSYMHHMLVCSQVRFHLSGTIQSISRITKKVAVNLTGHTTHCHQSNDCRDYKTAKVKEHQHHSVYWEPQKHYGCRYTIRTTNIATIGLMIRTTS